jgi:hypothetical protein
VPERAGQGLSAGEGRDRGFPDHTAIAGNRNQMTPGNNMKAAEETYNGFIGMVKWGTAISAIVTIIVVLLIA